MELLKTERAANELFAETVRGLAHPKRLQLLNLLAQTERSVEELAAIAGVPVATTSAQLQTLRRAGLVARRREATRIYYRLAGQPVLELLVALQRAASGLHAAQGMTGPIDETRDDIPVRTMERAQLMRSAQAGEVVVLDVRPTEEFESGHIPGALSVPVGELAERLGEIPADVEVVAYCRGAYCLLSHDAVRLLRDRGRTASILDHGMNEWRVAGEPVGAGR
jgi:rhodanese-related sulfurtransferase/DNA-binding transcriptional ArsR family regulator